MANSAAQRAAQARYRKRHPEKVRRATKSWVRKNKQAHCANRLQWRIANHNRILLMHAEKRARQKGLPFNITVDDFSIPAYCPVLGVPLRYCVGKRTGNSPSLDRVIPALGYVRGNVHVISWRANDLKGDGSLEELKKVVAWLELQHEEAWLQ